MNSSEAVLAVVDALEQLDVPFMIVGSFSSNVYGTPRSTKDADFVVEMEKLNLNTLGELLKEDFVLDRQMGFETVTGTSLVRLKHRQTEFSIDLFGLSGDPHDQARFARRVEGDIGGRKVFVASAEDVIIMKVRWFLRANRAKDRNDVLGILAVQDGNLDFAYIRGWTHVHSTTALFEELLNSQNVS